MYLIPHCVPIYADGDRLLLATDWKRSLDLLAESLGGRFGPLGIIGPVAHPRETEHVLEEIRPDEGLELFPQLPWDTTVPGYWLREHRRYLTALPRILERAQIIHGIVLDDLRPYVFRTMQAAWQRNLPTLLVLDQDYDLRMQRLTDEASPVRRPYQRLLHRLYSSRCREAARRVDMCMFKGKSTVARYGPLAREVHRIEDTSYLSSELVPEEIVRTRLQDFLSSGRPLRFVFCGRLVDIKGVDISLRMLKAAGDAGLAFRFDIYGGGPELASLRDLAASLAIDDSVHFHGAQPYGPDLLLKLAGADALLFTPRIDETPRMIFDGYAAGLPLVATGIDYVLERSEEDQAVFTLPRDDFDGSVRRLLEFASGRSRIAALTERAMQAARYNAADQWYRRRAEWTFAMMERRRARARG